jgi:glycosyltransferase involved in cell wall biosynthesis
MTHNLIRAMETVKFKGDSTCPIVVGFTPVSINAPKRRLIFYTMMETQGLHQEFVKRCNSATEIWVPCSFYEKVFKEAGVIKPIHVIPLGVNHLIFTPEAEEPDLIYELIPSGEKVTKLPDDVFRFISLFGWSYRKGPDILCKAFLREFNSTDDVCLVIYSRYMGSSAEKHKQYVRDEILGYYKEIGKENPPKIFYCGDEVPIPQLPGCYAAADAFVLCSRGEGFSLPLIEAAACGTPVISAYNTGMTQYLDDEVAWLVHEDGMGSANEKLCWISEYYRDQQFVILGEDSIRQCQEHMRTLFSNPKEAEIKSRKFRERVLNEYTWDACVSRVAKKLKSES